MNYDNYDAVLTYIERNPEKWDQNRWWPPHPECGTARCIAGWSAVFAGMAGAGDPFRGGVKTHAQKFLDADYAFSLWLFAYERTLDDFRRVRQVHATARLIEKAAA